MKTYVQETCTRMFTAALFLMARNCEHHSCPSWVNDKLQYVYTMEHYSTNRGANYPHIQPPGSLDKHAEGRKANPPRGFIYVHWFAIVSAIQLSDSAIYTYVNILFFTVFSIMVYYRMLSIEELMFWHQYLKCLIFFHSSCQTTGLGSHGTSHVFSWGLGTCLLTRGISQGR